MVCPPYTKQAISCRHDAKGGPSKARVGLQAPGGQSAQGEALANTERMTVPQAPFPSEIPLHRYKGAAKGSEGHLSPKMTMTPSHPHPLHGHLGGVRALQLLYAGGKRVSLDGFVGSK